MISGFEGLIIPIAKGFLGTLGSAGIIYGGGTYMYKKYLLPSPLTSVLEETTNKKFSFTRLVSREATSDGTVIYKYKIPTGLSTKDMLEIVPAIEDKLDCEVKVWSEKKMFVFETCSLPIPDRLTFHKEKIVRILKGYECAMYLGESRRGPVVLDFTNNATPHLLFGGPTGGGKSNLLNQGICGMLERYSSEQLNFYLIDLKDGVELSPYKDIEHVKGFYENVGEVSEGLSQILLELKRRNGLFKSLGVKKLSQYNEISEEILPRIVVVADEFAQFNNVGDKELKKHLYSQWEEILQKGRSTGIHVVIGTQIADADVFPKQIKGNIDARFGFKFTDVQHSKMISGGSELTYLPNIQGRGLFKLGTSLINTQVPYIPENEVTRVISTYRKATENINKLEEKENEIFIEKTVDTLEIKTGAEPVKENEVILAMDGLEGIEDLFIKEEDIMRAKEN